MASCTPVDPISGRPEGRRLTGVLLAGGRSRRMGRNKALLDVDGEPLWRRQVRVLRGSGVDAVAVVLRPGQELLPGLGEAEVRVLRDLQPEAGPLAGLHAALMAFPQTRHFFLLAVDLPRIEAGWFRWLQGFCDRGTGAIVQHDGGYEPLAAIYPAGALPAVADHLARGEFSLQRLTGELVREGRLRSLPPPAGRLDWLANWNEPGDVSLLHSETTVFS